MTCTLTALPVTVLPVTVLPGTALPGPTLPGTALVYNALQNTDMYCTAYNFHAHYYTGLYYTALNHTKLQCTTFSTLPCTNNFTNCTVIHVSGHKPWEWLGARGDTKGPFLKMEHSCGDIQSTLNTLHST